MLTTKDMGVSGANTAGKSPSLGSIVARQLGPRDRGMPAYASVPVASSIGLSPGYFAGNMIGAQYDPFQTGGGQHSHAQTYAERREAQILIATYTIPRLRFSEFQLSWPMIELMCSWQASRSRYYSALGMAGCW